VLEYGSFEMLHEFMGRDQAFVLKHRENVPFLIREHARKFQYGVSDCTVWERA